MGSWCRWNKRHETSSYRKSRLGEATYASSGCENNVSNCRLDIECFRKHFSHIWKIASRSVIMFTVYKWNKALKEPYLKLLISCLHVLLYFLFQGEKDWPLPHLDYRFSQFNFRLKTVAKQEKFINKFPLIVDVETAQIFLFWMSHISETANLINGSFRRSRDKKGT